MRTLITGLSGFTGKYLQNELVQYGHEVFGLKSDLTDLDAVKNEVKTIHPEWVVHLAGIAFIGHGDLNDFYKVNLMGTRNLLEALSNCSSLPKSVLLASSSNVYGNHVEQLTENSETKPANDYAVSKLAMEQMAKLWFDRLPIIIVRPFNYTGIGQSESFLIPKMVSHFTRKASVIELGNLDIWRDLSDVRAIVFAYRRLLEECPSNETINVCSGKAYSLREILSMMEEIVGYKIDVKVNKNFVRKSEVKSLWGDPKKLLNVIGHWSNPPLEKTIKWMVST